MTVAESVEQSTERLVVGIRKKWGFAWHVGLATCDQALLSAANFIVGLLLIRYAPPGQYALYVLAFSALLLAAGMQNALVNSQMTILSPQYTPQDRLRFVGTLSQQQYRFWLPLGGLALLLSGVVQWLRPTEANIWLVTCVTLAAMASFFREFLRQAFFLYLKPLPVLLFDAVFVCILVGVVWFTTTSEYAALWAVSAIGTGAALSGYCGFLFFKKSIGWSHDFDGVLGTVWQHGKWALLGVVVTWLHNQGFLYLLNAMQGAGDVEDVSACRLLLMPINMLLVSVDTVLKPRGATWLANNEKQKLFSVAAAMAALLAAIAIVWVLTLRYFEQPLMTYVFERQIAKIDLFILTWGLVTVTQILRTTMGVIFQIMKLFDLLFYVAIAATVISLAVGVWAIHEYGALGSLWGLMAGELTHLFGMSVCLLLSSNATRSTTPTR